VALFFSLLNKYSCKILQEIIMVQKALIVGINAYPSSPLQGCVNDARDMEALIKDHFGFTNVVMLLDGQATTANIKAALTTLVSGAQPGDGLLFHYSGHGSQIRDTADLDSEPDGLDEIICPVDLDWNTKIITDDYLKWAFNQVPAGVNLVVFLDSCNSGGALDQTGIYQPVVGAVKAISDFFSKESRYLPPPAHLKPLMEGMAPKPRSVQSRDVDATGLLISGCQAQQTSADAFINGRYNGAATYSLITSLKAANYDLDYKTLVDQMNNFMLRNGYSQRPELNGSSTLYSTKFLKALPVENVAPTPAPEPTPPPPTDQQPGGALEQLENKKDKKTTLFLIAGAVAVLIAILTLT
jgi:hypothetical protein